MDRAAAWQQALGWNESASRRTQIITGSIGLVLLFCGVVMQWWAGNNISDVSLATFCESYSGDRRLMEPEDWKAMKADYYDVTNPDRDGPLSLNKLGQKYFGGDGKLGSLERLIYREPAFWCKSLPACPAGARCNKDSITAPGTSKAHGVWKDRTISELAYWHLADGAMGSASSHIRCWDKFLVYRGMLKEVLTEYSTTSSQPRFVTDEMSGQPWSDATVDSAAWAELYSCYSSKGATGYALGLGPLLSSLACIFCVLSMFTCCPRSYASSLGRGLALMGFSFTLIGFWVLSFSTTGEFISNYVYCGGAGFPLVSADGKYFDGTPCMDRTSLGDNMMNPFLSWSAWMSGVYTFGGVLNILAIIFLLVTIAKTIESDQLRKFVTLTPSDEL
mmetsp:Transcript_20881/g.40598  ORF Transcript_20881/g.40598 Transcript_20881/m.40598 type:complete len:390 (+) Transcript_20881:101-1270(+)